MKLEPGKYYKTRLGQKAYVAGLTPDEMCFNERCRVLGCIRDKNGYWFTKSWSLGGSCDPSYDNGHDLVSEWTEPVVHVVNIWRNEEGFLTTGCTPKEGLPFFAHHGKGWKLVKQIEVTLD